MGIVTGGNWLGRYGVQSIVNALNLFSGFKLKMSDVCYVGVMIFLVTNPGPYCSIEKCTFEKEKTLQDPKYIWITVGSCYTSLASLQGTPKLRKPLMK